MKLYVSNYLSNSISIIDCDTLTLEREIYLGDDICTHHFCIEKDKDIIYLPSASDGVLYVLDEPSIGLHQKDNEKLSW